MLKPSDGVRTQDGSYAVLVGGEYWEVKMESGTEVEVGELSSSISRLLLGSGMAHATVRGGGRHSFEVKATKGDALARTDAGTFTISSNGEGTVAVGTDDGQVELSGKGQVVIVRAGQRSVVLPGQAPTDPVAVPSSLLLKVALPAVSLTNKNKVVVLGQTEPGAHVEIAGHVIKVDATGPLRDRAQARRKGRNAVDVRAMSSRRRRGLVEALGRARHPGAAHHRRPESWGVPKKPAEIRRPHGQRQRCAHRPGRQFHEEPLEVCRRDERGHGCATSRARHCGHHEALRSSAASAPLTGRVREQPQHHLAD